MLKSEIRALFKQKRKGLSFLELNRNSKQITRLILEQFDFKNRNVSIFLPIEKHKEFDSYSLLETLIKQSATPIVSKSNFEDGSMTLFKYENADQLEINSFGIPEPKFGETVSESLLEFVLVPLLAIDKHGNRVGYGKGFYDKLLAKCNPECITIGINLFNELIEIDDLNPYDVRLNYCVTPNFIYDFKR
ncbi:MAG: 5-formyltetrahydrofolate cyclo-ligase [Flavobacteriales bacterium]|nr:5-formyltetrahydrofolate cyclo-ligase [Flavobacteriales bacterium]NCA21305.1 5-formyltetrahydrofolate cyclo-ligase [Crocinitomicaceae bacterium]